MTINKSYAFTVGYGYYGGLGNGTTGYVSIPTSVSSTINWKQLASGQGHVVGLDSSTGLAWAWGYNGAGELGIGNLDSKSLPTSVSSTTSWKAIASGNDHVVAIRGSDGLAYAWGYNASGQLGDKSTTNRSIPVSVSSTISWKMIACGNNFTIGINGANGLAYGWGYDGYGQLGKNTAGGDVSVPTSVSSTISWKVIACGLYGVIGINGANGLAYAWGRNSYGELGVNSQAHKSVPSSVSSTISWKAVGRGDYFTMGINGANGALWGWGMADNGRIAGANAGNNCSVPYSASSADSWVSLACGNYYSFATNSNGRVYGWGNNSYGVLGTGNTTTAYIPTSMSANASFFCIAPLVSTEAANIPQFAGICVVGDWPAVTTQDATNIGWSCLTANGNVTTLGDYNTKAGICYKVGTSGDPVVTDTAVSNAVVATGAYTNDITNLTFDKGYRIRTLAYHDGMAPNIVYGSTVQATTLDRVREAAPRANEIDYMEYFNNTVAQSAYSPSLKGYIWSWGLNDSGQLGLNNITSYSIPQSISTSYVFNKIGIGYRSVVAINADSGLLYGWGRNTRGTLGCGDWANKSVPTSALCSFSFASICCGDEHSGAIKGADGLAYTWGYNAYGQLGNNTVVSSNSPISVSSTISWKQLCCGNYYSGGINGANGLAYCWGNNDSGRLGDNSVTSRSIPVSVSSVISWKEISLGFDATIGINGANGLAYAWGDNTTGQLGDGTNTNRSVPVSVSSTISWKTIKAGVQFMIGIDGATGRAYGWGNNVWGSLGTGNRTNYSVPTSVSSTVSWAYIHTAAYSAHVAALTPNGLAYTWGYNVGGQLGNNSTTSSSVPVSVSSALSYNSVFAGSEHTIGIISLGSINSYSEPTIKSEGSYSLKIIAGNEAPGMLVTRTLSGADQIVDLRGVNTLQFDIYSSRTGSNIKVGLYDSVSTTTIEITPNVLSANSWQTVSWDISAVANANKSSITKIVVTVVEASSANTFYIDNFKMTPAVGATDVFGILG